MTKTPLSKVVIDGRNLGPTGIGRYTLELLRELARQHPQIIWYLLTLPKYAVEVDKELLARPNVAVKITASGYYSLAEQWRLAGEIDALGADLFHATNFNVPRGLKTPLLTTVHDLTLLTHPGRQMWPGKRWLYERVLRRALRQSRRLITDSNDVKKDIASFARRRRLGAVGRKTVVIPLGVDSIFFQRLRPAARLTKLMALNVVNPYFLLVGAQLQHKNAHRAVAAFAAIARQPDFASYKLVIAGRRTRPAPDFDAALAAAKLGDRLHFTGPVADSELLTLYQGAAALIFISAKEGFGLPILEAMACGCPVITNKVSAMPEVAGVDAWYANPLQTKSVVAAMRQVAKNSATVKEKVKRARRRARKFTWRRCAELTFIQYEKTVR